MHLVMTKFSRNASQTRNLHKIQFSPGTNGMILTYQPTIVVMPLVLYIMGRETKPRLLQSFTSIGPQRFSGCKTQEAAPVAERLRSLTSVLLIIRSSHRCGFAPRTGHESHVGQAKFCLRVCQVVFPRVFQFSPHLLIDLSRYE